MGIPPTIPDHVIGKFAQSHVSNSQDKVDIIVKRVGSKHKRFMIEQVGLFRGQPHRISMCNDNLPQLIDLLQKLQEQLEQEIMEPKLETKKKEFSNLEMIVSVTN